MKRHLFSIISIAAVLLTGCIQEIEMQEPSTPSTGEKVTYTFTPHFCGMSDEGLETKAMAVKPQVKNIYVAVFDAAGYKLSEYAQANPCELATENGTDYNYSVELTISDEPRIVHIIANAPSTIPFGSETEVIGSLCSYYNADESTEWQDAYWDRVELPNGVSAKPDPTLETSNKTLYDSQMAAYEAICDILSDVELVRNFTQINVVNNATNFVVSGFWLTNVPDRGAVAPYNRNTYKFQENYKTFTSINNLRGTGTGQGNYQGFYPASAELIKIDGLSSTELAAKKTAIASDKQTTGASTFCYEREIAVEGPLYIIVEGKYNGSADPTYYKIDLRDDDGAYFPILRNFVYRVNIKSVSRNGWSSVAEALASAPTGDLTTSLEFQGLTNMSDGTAQIYVTETEKVIVNSSTTNPNILVGYKFIPDITSTATDPQENILLEKLLTTGGGSYANEAAVQAAKLSYVTITSDDGGVFDSWSVATSDEADDYRYITLTPNISSDVIKTEVFTIVGHYWNSTDGAYDTLTRTIKFILRKKLTMTLAFEPSEISKGINVPIDLVIGLETGLPSSIFDLDLVLETEKLTLTTNNDPLAITTGATTIGTSGKPAFQFIKTITWDEYSAATADGSYKYFRCHFKTNAPDLSGDKLYASNEYFNQASTFYTTYTPYTFSSLAYGTGTKTIGTATTFSFSMSTTPSDGTVYLEMHKFAPSATETRLTYVGTASDGYDIYSLSVSGTSVSGLSITPLSAGIGDIRLRATHFTTANKTVDITGGTIPFFTSTNLVDPQGYKVYGDNLIVGQKATLTVYVSTETGTVKIGETTATKGDKSVVHDGEIYYPYTITYTAPTPGATYASLKVKLGSDELGSVSIPVYGISLGPALSDVTHSQYSNTGSGWYVFVNKNWTSYHLYSDGTNLEGTTDAYDYNSLLGFSSESNTVQVMVPSKGSTPYYMKGTGNNSALTMSTSGTSYTLSYSSGIQLYYSSTRYWRQGSNTGTVQTSSYTNNRTWYVYPVTFTAPTTP